MIDWARMVKPQPDGYDTRIALELSSVGHYESKHFDGNGPVIWPDGRARWSTVAEMPMANWVQLPYDDPRVQQGLPLLDLWPEARKQAAELLHALAPMSIGSQGGHGCSCGNYRDDFGWIFTTADEPWGFCEGVVHETAHWKLRALGIWFESWDSTLLDHTFDQRYDSPVRKDMQRPMGAVLHGQYSYIHVAEMVRRMYEAKGEAADVGDADWLDLQLRRITEGQGTLRAYARGTKGAGETFLAALDDWTSEVISAGRAALPAKVTL